MKFFTADHHFNHGTLARLREFASVVKMNEFLIEAWNAYVNKGDLVYHLGDIMFPRKADGHDPGELLSRLEGQIILVEGNHDHKNRNVLKDHPKIQKRCDIEYIKLSNQQRVMLCHYPMITWRASVHGSWHLHGHSHGNPLNVKGLRLDVGVDTTEFYQPYSERDIIRIMTDKEKTNENIDAK